MAPFRALSAAVKAQRAAARREGECQIKSLRFAPHQFSGTMRCVHWFLLAVPRRNRSSSLRREFSRAWLPSRPTGHIGKGPTARVLVVETGGQNGPRHLEHSDSCRSKTSMFGRRETKTSAQRQCNPLHLPKLYVVRQKKSRCIGVWVDRPSLDKRPRANRHSRVSPRVHNLDN